MNKKNYRIGVFGLWHLGCVICGAWTKLGFKVTGFDYDKNYIEKAIDNIKEGKNNLKYFVADIIDGIESKYYGGIKFDYIFLIDVFLFFFDEKFQKRLYDNSELILKNISKMLSKNGKIIIKMILLYKNLY